MDYLGLSFEQLDEEAVVELLRTRAAGTDFAYLVTPNVDHVVRLSETGRDSELWAAYRRAAWRLCDSHILSRLASFQSFRLPVVSGSDLTERVIRDVALLGDHICLIGGRQGDAATISRLRPDLLVSQHIPPMGLREDVAARAEAARFAVAAGARFTFLAVGSPQQELIALAMSGMPGASGTGLCVGAGIDFLTGRARRAPRWMRGLALEWLYRLLGDPRRLWRRYLLVGPRIFLLAWKFRRPARASADRPAGP